MQENLTPPARIHALAKPTGAICNLGCEYCFFLEKEQFYPGSRFKMSDELLETYIRQLIESHSGKQVTVAWQGGEPTMRGLDFFRRAIEYQEKYKKPGMTFENTIQTNGTLLTDAWCEFLRENNYLVGISIDGPRDLHDHYRVDKRGRPTFDKVLRGLRLLQKHGVDYNVLTTVNSHNADHPLEVYRFLRDDIGTEWIQFIPVVERLNDDGSTLCQQGTRVTDRSVRPAQFGRFLVEIFDEWVRNDVARVYVQTFEATVRNWLGMNTSGMCFFDPVCGHGVALEHNGDLYSCDHFVEPDYLLGNIEQDHMQELVTSDFQVKFGRDKRDALPMYCKQCDVLFACHGECPKNRLSFTPDGEPGLNYLCEGYKAFFHHVDKPLKMMVNLAKRGRPLPDIMQLLAQQDARIKGPQKKIGRNDPCPCGSGKKFKKCHGA